MHASSGLANLCGIKQHAVLTRAWWAVVSLQVAVLPTSSSNGTYFKVSGVMVTRRISSYDNGDYTDVLLLNAMEGEEYKLKTEG